MILKICCYIFGVLFTILFFLGWLPFLIIALVYDAPIYLLFIIAHLLLCPLYYYPADFLFLKAKGLI